MKTTQKIEPKALLVARVSDVEQRKALPAQKKRLYEYAKRCRWTERQDFRYVEFDSALFNRCQMIKDKRKSMKTKWDSLDFNFSDNLSCAKCGRTISPFQCKRWVYLKCANSKCDNPNTAESLVLGSIEALVKQISIPEVLLNKVIKELKNNHDDQQAYYSQSLTSVRQEFDEIDKKLETWFEKLVDELITPEQHDRIVKTLTERQKQLNDRLDVLTKGNKDFLVTASYLLDLVSRVEELFELADEGQRSKLIGFLVSNLIVNDKKLSYTVNYPFNLVIEEKEKEPSDSETSLWCSIVDAFQTAAIDAQEDYKLKYLVEQFQLEGSLI